MLVTKFLTGIKYTAKPHDILKSYGTINIAFGTVSPFNVLYLSVLYYYKQYLYNYKFS